MVPESMKSVMPALTMDPPPNSQDVHHSPVLNAILAPIRNLNENWKVDLSTHLEQYLREICEQQQGLGSVNFVEAALLIQRSAGIYVKKVEYLWNLLMQVLESFRKKGVTEKGNEKRKKSGHISDLYQDFVDITVNPDKKKWKGKELPVKLDPPYYSELEYNCPKEKKLSLFDHMFEPLGDKSDFRLNYPISGSFMLEEELSYSYALEDDCIDMNIANEEEGSHVSGENNDADEEGDGNANDVAEPMDIASTPLVEDGCAGLVGEGNVIATVVPHPPVDVWDSEAGSIPDKSVKVQERIKMPCDTLEKKKRGMLDSSVSSLVTDNISVSFGNRFEEFPKFRNEFMKEKNKKKVAFQKAEEVEEYRKTLASDFPVDFLGFEDLDISGGEDEFVGYHDDFDREDALPADPDEANADPEGSAAASADDIPLPNVVNLEDNDDWGQIYQNILQEKMHSARVGHQDAQAALASRVNQWHDSIRTKLKGAEDRKCMDIHEYETHILNTFPKGATKTQKTTIDFAEVVKDVEDEEICRYFLASLLLVCFSVLVDLRLSKANNYNVEINVSDRRELAMNCMELTLLKSTRHHESLEDYQAPSQVETQNHNRKRR
ncbi:Uncharacterized protein GBIM_06177 [Gryllus bimaculatus]|nr:Uncharacterized protein GBIM_06177 [Gryllus bimaculatus]